MASVVEAWLVENWALSSGRVELVGEMIGNESEKVGGIDNGISSCDGTSGHMKRKSTGRCLGGRASISEP